MIETAPQVELFTRLQDTVVPGTFLIATLYYSFPVTSIIFLHDFEFPVSGVRAILSDGLLLQCSMVGGEAPSVGQMPLTSREDLPAGASPRAYLDDPS